MGNHVFFFSLFLLWVCTNVKLETSVLDICRIYITMPMCSRSEHKQFFDLETDPSSVTELADRSRFP